MIARSSAKVLLVGLALVSPAAHLSAEAGMGDWAAARAEALHASPREAGPLWGEVALSAVALADYYARLGEITGELQIEIARLRRVSYPDSSAIAAVHGFIVTARYDSAVGWAGRDPAVSLFKKFAAARIKNQPFSFAEMGASNSASNATVSLQLALLARAGGDTLTTLAQRFQNSKFEVTPEVALILAMAANDTNAVAAALEKLEVALATPPGDNAPVLARFGDPLSYMTAARAHALLAIEASSRALVTTTGPSVSQLHVLRGKAYYAIGKLDLAAVDLKAADDPFDVPTAAAYLAGIAIHQADRKSAADWQQRCLTESLRELDGGYGLLAAARVQVETGEAGWEIERTAGELVRRNKKLPTRTHVPYWAWGVVAERTSPNEASRRMREASDGKPPLLKQGFDASFCIDYTGVLITSGLHGNSANLEGRAGNLLMAYNALHELAEVMPATRSAAEGARWLYSAIFGQNVETPTD
jgi:tetratricopeptide (TPR) repeat protein